MGRVSLNLKSLSKNAMVYVAFVLFFVIFSITLRNVGHGFLSPGNLWNIVRQTSLIAILSVGMTFALGAGQIDLSIGSVVGVSSLTTALIVQSVGIVPGVLAGLTVGVVVGAFNGCLVAFLKVPPFIATFGTQIVFAGVARTMTGLRSIPITNSTFNYWFGGGDLGVVPVLLLWMLLVTVIGHIYLRKKPFGRQVLVVGGNRKAALYSGISYKKTVIKVMMISGTLAGLVGVLWSGRFGGGRYSLGAGEEASAIAAAVIGGTSIFGGKASVVGACVGAVMMGMINNALVMYGLDVHMQMIVRGFIIIAAVAITSNQSD
ncbi:MAG: ABC transporter permease [Oscillospiraceae bacterium]|nr:ABC transporter permease [Oscillospiraceae bacterium]